MCLSVPGKLVSIDKGGGERDNTFFKTGKVSFGGILKEVNLAYVPEAKTGDYVLVHVGFAITILDEEAAKATFQYLSEIDEQEDAGASRSER